MKDRVADRFKYARTVKVLIDREATLKARAQFSSHPDGIVGTFETDVTLYRIFDGEELARILQTGRITGGTYSVKAERAFGASWAEDISAVISWGNRLRGGRLGDELYLAKLSVLGKTFYHLDPGIPFDPESPEDQEATWDVSKCNLGLGCSVKDVSLSEVDLFRVDDGGQIHRLTVSEAKELVKPPKPVDLRPVNSQLLQGSILGVDVRVAEKNGLWSVHLNDDRVIVTGAKSKEDAIELAQMSIRMRPDRPIRMDGAILEAKRKHEKHFEVDSDPEKTRGSYGLKPRDQVVVTKGSRNLGIDGREVGTVTDVYQRAGQREVIVKLLFKGKATVLYAQHPNRLKDDEIALMNSSGSKILVRMKKAASVSSIKVALRAKGRKSKDQRLLAKKLVALEASANKLRAKVKRDLQSSDPDQFMTALAVALMDEIGQDVLAARRGQVRLSEEEGTASLRLSKGKARKVATPFVVQALMNAYHTIDADEDGLFAHDLGSITVSSVSEYLQKFSLTERDLRGLHGSKVLKSRLDANHASREPLPRSRKAKQKILRKEFETALREASEYVGLEGKTLRLEYLMPGLESSYLQRGQAVAKKASESMALRVVARTLA